MGFLKDKINAAKEAEAKAQDEQARAPVKPAEKKAKRGFLEKIGLKVEEEATAEDVAEADRNKAMLTVYEYIRRQIDQGAQEYFANGDATKLREFVARPTLDAMLAHLDSLRASQLTLSQPDRKITTNAQTKVISAKADRFTVEERFSDHAVLRDPAGRETSCGGDERLLRVTVEVAGGQSYKVLSVVKVGGSNA